MYVDNRAPPQLPFVGDGTVSGHTRLRLQVKIKSQAAIQFPTGPPMNRMSFNEEYVAGKNKSLFFAQNQECRVAYGTDLLLFSGEWFLDPRARSSARSISGGSVGVV